MKHLIYLFCILTLLVSCNKEEDFTFSVSSKELSFDVSKSEQVISVTTEAEWEATCDAEWVLVRQQQNRMRVIVDSNPTENERQAIINILCNGKVQTQINIKQVGLILQINSTNYNVSHIGEDNFVDIVANTDWHIDNSNNWIKAQKEGEKLRITIARNYQMQERIGELKLYAGELSKIITIKQSESPWYDSFEMIPVESGTFLMGAQKDLSERDNYDEYAYPIESPVHSVTINAYYIGKFEVTQAQWFAAMGNNPSSVQGDNLPVENITWEQVQEFITRLNQMSGKNFRLPTEAEWEFAAKGGKKTNNYKYSGFSVLAACGWYYSNSESTIHEIGSKYPNELGIYDMSGNVREWCNDWFANYPTYAENNPQGPSSGNLKINRGGSWTTSAINCRNSYRHTDFPNEASNDLGFRLALSE